MIRSREPGCPQPGYSRMEGGDHHSNASVQFMVSETSSQGRLVAPPNPARVNTDVAEVTSVLLMPTQ
jgi:hypothetical protein